MKKNLFYFFFLSSFSSFAQIVVNSPEYNERKLNNSLNGLQVISATDTSTTLQFYKPSKDDPSISKSGACNCYVEPDASYTLAMTPNDDGSSAQINIPFDFCFYGQTFNQLFINNNGNITFETSLSGFSSTAFPSDENKIIAPFWADVDTRGTGQVVYKVTPTALFVNWVAVGYFNNQVDKVNSFQLIISNGTDPSIIDGNVAFCYKDMQWTTGSASSGIDGFEGIPATAGANKGDNLGFFQVAQFDHPGSDFDGALGNTDGISWLDNKTFFFDICNALNTPPIPDGISSCDTFTLCALSDTADIQIKFLSPEADQTTTLSFSTTNNIVVTEIQNVSGNTASLILQAIAEPGNEGYHTVTITATDNFVPPGITTVFFTIFVDPLNGADLDPQIILVEGCDIAALGVLNGPYDTYLWNDLSFLDSLSIETNGLYGVTVSRNGCYKKVDAQIQLSEAANLNLTGNFALCPGIANTLLTVSDSTKFSAISWGLASANRDSMYVNALAPNTYTITYTDSAGLCTKDTTFTISQQQNLVLQNDFTLCNNTFTFLSNTPSSGDGLWTVVGGGTSLVFSSNQEINPSLTFTQDGTYALIYTDSLCPSIDDTVNISIGSTPYFTNLNSDYYDCPNEYDITFFSNLANINITSIVWDASKPEFNSQNNVALPAGTYHTFISSPQGCLNDTIFTIGSQIDVNLFSEPNLCGLQLVMSGNNALTPAGTWTTTSGPGTASFASSSAVNTTINVTEFGTYTFAYSETVCNDNDNFTVTFLDAPTVNVDDIELCEGQTLELLASSNDPDALFSWTNGKLGKSIIVDTGGYFKVFVTNICGVDSDSAFVDLRRCVIDMPNIFTPNAGGTENQLFKVLVPSKAYEQFSCQIFNRWGNLMYEYNDVFGGWDGRATNGDECSPGTYFYKVTATSFTNETVNIEGIIQLIR